MKMIVAAFVLLAATACSKWPDLPSGTSSPQRSVWPVLLPLEQVLSGETVGTDPGRDADALARRAENLRRRAVLLRSPVTDQTDFERLRARLAQ